ncbi:quinone oxidoreductase family protein [Georgenia sp. Z1491]|uniref:quinone oxidoreductase family protein n=1 Tax=Georgenia sp. Z1491 TaxID=3416707 RepID=UPI003CE770AF
MLALRRKAAGEAEVAEVEEPTPGDGEVLVELRYASVNPFDLQVLRGEIGNPNRVLTLGAEGTGYVDGEPVQVSGAGLGAGRDGTFAPFVVAPTAAVRALPTDADLATVATLGVAGRTAWRAVHQLAEVGPSDVVLVLGATGGVGTYAVQLARQVGALVLAHTGNADKIPYLEGLGAETVLAREGSELASLLRGADVSVVLDPLGGDYVAELAAVIAPRARIVTYGILAGEHSRWNLGALYRKGLRVFGTSGSTTTAEESAQSLKGAWDAVLDGVISLDLRTLPLSGSAQAFDLLSERRVTGKLLIEMPVA